MFYLLWAILNIVLFIVIAFKGSKYLRERFGPVAGVVFVLVLIAFVGHLDSDKDNNEQNPSQVKTWRFNSSDSLDRSSNGFIDVDLESTLISKYILGIGYGKDLRLQHNIPLVANTFTTGFHSGTRLIPVSITVNQTNDNQSFKYEVYGTIKWSLLGLPIYFQPKHWEGIAVVK